MSVTETLLFIFRGQKENCLFGTLWMSSDRAFSILTRLRLQCFRFSINQSKLPILLWCLCMTWTMLVIIFQCIHVILNCFNDLIYMFYTYKKMVLRKIVLKDNCRTNLQRQVARIVPQFFCMFEFRLKLVLCLCLQLDLGLGLFCMCCCKYFRFFMIFVGPRSGDF